MQLTPRQFIEGYQNPFLQRMFETPVYMGGSLTIPFEGFVSIDPMNGSTVTRPAMAEFLFETGDGYRGAAYTRAIQTYMGSDVVQVQTLEYNTLTTTSTIAINPWYSTQLNYNYQVEIFPSTDGW